MKNGKSRPTERTELGHYIVADPEICHGKPTFKGTRIMVWQVLDDVADGRSWDFICNTRWGGRIPLAAVAEAVKLAEEAWLGERDQCQALCHASYCLVWLDVDADDAALYVRRLLRHPRFATQAKRMGTVIRAHHNGVHFWQRNRRSLQRAEW